jgi:hypothetical protein
MMGRYYMRTIMVACALVLGFASLGSVSAGNDKVDICHYEENKGWKLLSVGQPAAGAHLEQHDDALPGGTTSQTGTVLDKECVEITCPCEGLAFRDTPWDDSFETQICHIDPRNKQGGLNLHSGIQEIYTSQSFTGERSCAIQATVLEGCGPDTPEICLVIAVTEEQNDACVASLRRIAANDGVPCD